ncbi:PREDICTED: RHOMBOID-like protein 4 [Tarenaya hassleriana]|uniref:RHOMBOID-like protein 4 n=1 Tax=Tarenaya hassleriana TaxID=28532 RepID=UPI0008FD3C64|nr:PREDICTED: RHOMBOID-like protein 4 [Tarenaya hassleriana]
MGVPELKTTPIWGNSRLVENNINPVGMDVASHGGQNRVVYREVKQFRSWVPWIIPCFVVANVVMFVITMFFNNCPKKSGECFADFLGRFSFQSIKENPLLGPSSLTLQKMGGLDVKRVVQHQEEWRLISCNWLHGGVIHLVVNMITLLIIGIRMEREFGFLRIGLLYVISGLGGSILSALFLRSSVSVGASGAMLGLLGGILSEIIINWTIYTNKAIALVTVVVLVAVNLAMGFLPGVDNFAHIGGLATGFLLGFVLLIRPHFGWISHRPAPGGVSSAASTHRFKIYQCVLWTISLVLLMAGFVIGLVALFNNVDGNKQCSWCHYLSRIPTSR